MEVAPPVRLWSASTSKQPEAAQIHGTTNRDGVELLSKPYISRAENSFTRFDLYLPRLWAAPRAGPDSPETSRVPWPGICAPERAGVAPA